jgi:hypothetical protein
MRTSLAKSWNSPQAQVRGQVKAPGPNTNPFYQQGNIKVSSTVQHYCSDYEYDIGTARTTLSLSTGIALLVVLIKSAPF